MLSKKMEKAINDQINAELYSSYLYLSMSAFFEEQNLPGSAAWMRAQAQEELVHAMKFFSWINERRGRVTLAAIEKPGFEWGSPLEAFEASFKHEQYISSRINDLVALAIEEKDFATRNMLNWFVDEQVEEESSVDAVLQQLRMVSDSKHGLYMLDRELGGRQAGTSTEEEA